jgi:CheY-like chemotaxis protein
MVDVPIVAMTANAFSEDRAACLAAGATDHVAKPVEPSVLRATLACWLSDEQHHLDLVADTELSASLSAPGVLPGLSPERGMRYTSGDARSYLRWLHRFASTNGPAVAELLPGDADITGDHAALLALAHRLKGSAGLIGAVEVEELATELNDVLRAGPTDASVVAMARALGDALGRVVAAIATLPIVEVDDGGGDGRSVDALVDELDQLLASADVLATDLWARRRAQLGPALGERSTAVGAAIERYDYDEALRLLRATAAR